MKMFLQASQLLTVGDDRNIVVLIKVHQQLLHLFRQLQTLQAMHMPRGKYNICGEEGVWVEAGQHSWRTGDGDLCPD